MTKEKKENVLAVEHLKLQKEGAIRTEKNDKWFKPLYEQAVENSNRQADLYEKAIEITKRQADATQEISNVLHEISLVLRVMAKRIH